MLKTCIVDDEKKGRDTLQKLLEVYCPSVEVIGHADSVNSAFQFINKEKTGACFLRHRNATRERI